MRILVAGRYADVSRQGGATWAILQWVLGLRRLGHEVALVEPVGEVGADVLGFRQEVLRQFELPERIEAPDLLVNVSGLLRDEGVLERIPVRLYLDLDPGFTQLWHEQGVDMGFDRHTHFASVGLELGVSAQVPVCGREWISTVPPVVLEHWPIAGPVAVDAFTTVGNWRSYGSIDRNGVRYGQRAHSVRGLLDLPEKTDQAIMPAFAIHPDESADLAALREHGWRLLDPAEVASTPARYREFVQGSKGELGIAKEGYVVSRCGWFSDRSACYLASGRPVVAQDTGFSAHLPVGEGLLAFTTADEAASAIARVVSDYKHHCSAARDLAEECFDSDIVLGRLLRCL